MKTFNKIITAALLVLILLSLIACQTAEDNRGENPENGKNSESLSEIPETSDESTSNTAPESTPTRETSKVPESSAETETTKIPETSEEPETTETPVPPTVPVSFDLPNPPQNPEDPENYTRINGKDIYFISDSEKETWRPYLVKLLENVRQNLGDPSSAPFPDKPSVDDCVSFGLFDINFDGIPELIGDTVGGTAGNRAYIVYDLKTGETPYNFTSDFYGSWAYYYNVLTGKLEAAGLFQYRYGWEGAGGHLMKITYNEKNKSYNAYSVIYAEYELHTKEDFQEIDYMTVKFTVNNNKNADFWDYYSVLGEFNENCIRIKETALVDFFWHDFGDSDANGKSDAEKMADALISSSQKFIKP